MASGSDPDAEQEAVRHKTLAESKFRSSNLKSALKHARKALCLSPRTVGLSSMVTAFEIVSSAAASGDVNSPEWYKILQVEPFSHMNTIKQRYRKLALVLHPDKNNYVGCEEAFKLVNEAFSVFSDAIRKKEYDMKLRIKIQEERVSAVDGKCDDDETATFWTACSGCQLFHKFEKKYLGHNLMCPNCKKSFKTTEIDNEEEGKDGEDNGACVMNKTSEIITYKRRRRMSDINKMREEKEEASDTLRKLKEAEDEADEGLTLAQMQSKLKRNKANSKSKICEKDLSGEASNDVTMEKKRKRNRNTMNEESDVKIKLLEECEFYDFAKEKTPRSIKKGQVWAMYNGGESQMPTSYCLIGEIVSVNPFKVMIYRLELENEKLISWVKTGSHVPCGRFRVAEKAIVKQLREFSNVVQYERAAREVYRIYPMKGSIWAVRRSNGGYDIVVCLTMYDDMYGLSIAYLEKVEGYLSLFKRREFGSHAVRRLVKDDTDVVLSHQIPARKLPDDQLPRVGLKECWVLDPASVPSDLC